MIRELGILLTAVAALGLHPAFAQVPLHKPETAVSWELHAFVDVDGIRKLDKKILKTPFNDLQSCIKYAIQLPMPEASKQVNGHTYVSGYTCVRVEVPAVST